MKNVDLEFFNYSLSITEGSFFQSQHAFIPIAKIRVKLKLYDRRSRLSKGKLK